MKPQSERELKPCLYFHPYLGMRFPVRALVWIHCFLHNEQTMLSLIHNQLSLQKARFEALSFSFLPLVYPEFFPALFLMPTNGQIVSQWSNFQSGVCKVTWTNIRHQNHVHLTPVANITGQQVSTKASPPLQLKSQATDQILSAS